MLFQSQMMNYGGQTKPFSTKFGLRLAYFLAYISILTFPSLAAGETAECGASSKAGEECRCSIDLLRPMQFSVGKQEVLKKEAKLQRKQASPADLDEYLSDNPETIIIGPGKSGLVYYLIDGNHHAAALYNAHIKTAYCKIKENDANASIEEFWKHVTRPELNYVWLSDNGVLRSYVELPSSVADYSDDIYRTLAKEVEESGGFIKPSSDDQSRFLEFKWADYFRKKIFVTEVKSNFQKAVEDGCRDAALSEASMLPGYIPNNNCSP